ncbi:MAG TPA: ABC transporter permease [Candidatus Polarisedimenticolia bacterium]|nr:ABC transporter permease [Candidatus Polarisedimenticolia bacterium]
MALGAAVCCAVVTGALVVGDSVRGSLRGLALDRLGRIEQAITAERFMPETAAAALGPGAAPVLLLQGSARVPSRGARASGIVLLGVDGRFDALYPVGSPRPFAAMEAAGRTPFPPLALGAAVAADLSASVGEEVVISFPRPAEAPRDSVMGRRGIDDAAAGMRCVVAAIVPDRGAGRFSLSPHQSAPRNAWLRLGDLQRAAGRSGTANLTLLPQGAMSRDGTATPPLTLDRLALTVRPSGSHVLVEADGFVIDPAMESALREAARAEGAAVQAVQTSVAVALRHGARSVPYSTVTAVDPLDGSVPRLLLEDGTEAPALRDDQIVLGLWAAEDLKARRGDTVEMEFFAVQPDGALITRTAAFAVAGIARAEGLGSDRRLTPDYPGIQEARDIAAWDPPFPIDLGRIRPRDEVYWDLHGAAPKAFVSEAAGRRLWASRYGSVTSLRLAPAAGSGAPALAAALEARLASGPAEPFGVRAIDLRSAALRGAEGATDFGGLFLALSSFLIVSAALLAGLLFRLGVERRAPEIGLLRSLGFRLRQVRARFLAEGAILAAAGAAAGVPAGILYARGLLAGLGTLWKGAVGTSALSLHARPPGLALGAAIACLAVLAAMIGALRRLASRDPASLLSGRTKAELFRAPSRAALWMAAVAGAACAVMAWRGTTAGSASPGLLLAAGACGLASSLALFAAWCAAAGRGRPIAPRGSALPAMAARNAAWNPGRSLLTVSVIASACFILAAVAAGGHAEEDGGRAGGSGGFDWLARSDVPLPADPGTASGRELLGLAGEAAGLLARSEVIALRRVPGDDVSCLNLYRPERPALIGVPASLIERGGFRFHSAAAPVDNPWELLKGSPDPGVIPVIGDQNSVLWILHLGLGRDLAVRDETGRDLRLRFVALLQGSVFQSEVLMSEEKLLEHFPSSAGRSVLLIDPPEGAAEQAALLESALSRTGLDIAGTAETIAAFRAVESTYIRTFQALGGLGLLLGTCGLGVVMARNLLERQGELAAMRACGFPRSALKRLVLAEAGVLLAAGALIGCGAGLAASIPRLAGGLAGVQWAPLAVMVGGVLAAGLAAAAAATSGSLRAPLLETLKSER